MPISGLRKFIKIPGVTFLRGNKANARMATMALKQPAPRALVGLVERLQPGVRKQIHSTLAFSPLGGTIAAGKKGRRVYINRDLIKAIKERGSKTNLREIVHHEKFHTIPYIGNSEVLAHLYGGWKRDVGRRKNG